MGKYTYFADPLVIDAMVAKAAELSARYKGDNAVFAIGGLDEPWGAKNYILGEGINRTEGFAAKAFEQIRQQFGNGIIEAPKSPTDESALSWIAFNRWYDSQFQELQRRLYEGVKQADPDRLLFGHNFLFLRGVPAWDYDALAENFDVATLDPYTGRIEAESPDRAIYHTGFSTKLVADLTGKPVLPMPHFMEYWRKYPTAEEIVDYSSEALRCGAAGLFYILVDWGPYRYIRYPESHPERWDVLMRISDYLHEIPRLKFPATGTLVLFPTDSYAAFNETTANEVYVAHALIGEGAKVWYRFVSDRQIERNESALDQAQILYVPYAPYIETPVVERILGFVKGGGTVVLGDSSVFKFKPDGDSIDAGLRKELLPPASQEQIEKWPAQGGLPSVSIYKVGRGRVILMSENPFTLENVTNRGMAATIKKIQELAGADGASKTWDFSLPKKIILESITESESESESDENSENIVKNGGFEEGSEDAPAGWGFWTGEGEPEMGAASPGNSGKRCGYIKGKSKEDYGVYYQNMSLKPNTKYRVVLWYRYEKRTGDAGGAIKFAGKKVVLTPEKTEWDKKSFSVTTDDKTSQKLTILLYHRENTLFFDDVEAFEE